MVIYLIQKVKINKKAKINKLQFLPNRRIDKINFLSRHRKREAKTNFQIKNIFNWQNVFGKIRKIFRNTWARRFVYLTVIVVTLASTYIQNSQYSSGATFTFVQTQWDGTLAGAGATHGSDQTGFTDYVSKDSGVSLTGGSDPYNSVTLGISTGSIVQTDSSTDDNTSFNSASASYSSTHVDNTGDSASIQLSSSSSVSSAVDATGTDVYDAQIGSDGYSRILYTDNTVKYFVQCLNGSCSSKVTTNLASSGFNFGSGVFVLNSNDFAQIFYRDSSDNKLKFAQCANAACSSINPSSPVTILNSGGSAIDMTVDSSSNPVMIYSVSAVLSLAQCTTTNCSSFVTNPVASDGVGYGKVDSDLDLGTDDVPRIAYMSGAATDFTANFIQCGDAACSAGNSSNIIGYSDYDIANGGKQPIALQVDSGGIADVVFRNTTDDKATFLRCGNGACSSGNSTVAFTTQEWRGDVDIDIGPNGFPVIAYSYYVSGAPDLKIVSCDNATCSSYSGPTTVKLDIPWTGSGMRLRVGKDNYPRIAYVYDETNKDVYLYNPVFSTPGTYTSDIMDIGKNTYTWDLISWTHTLGKTITIQARTCDDAACSGETVSKAWDSVCSDITNGADLSTGSCTTDGDRYAQYRATLSTDDTSVTPSLDDVTINSSYYPTTQVLTSSPYNTTDAANIMGGLSWNEDSTLPAGTSATISLRTGSDGAAWGGWSDFTKDTSNCSKVSTTVTCTSDAMPAGMKDQSGDNWFQYKITLTSNGTNAPTIADVTTIYVVNAAPEVQTVSASQGSDGLVTVTYDMRDSDTTSDVAAVTLQYCTADCGGSPTWADAVTVSGDVGAGIAITNAYIPGTLRSITWTPKTDYDAQHNGALKVRIKANDAEGANNLGYGTSSSFALDTANPTGVSITAIDHTTNLLTLATPSDDSSYTMSVSNTLSFSTFVSFSSPYTYSSMTSDPATVYLRIKDAYGNTADSSATITPAKPANPVYYDTSDSGNSIYREFIAWNTISGSEVGAGFTSYNLWRSAGSSLTLNEELTNSDTTAITVTNGSLLPTSGTIIIGDEQITYTSKSTNDLGGTITRGVNNTVAASHSTGDAIWLKAQTSTDRTVNYVIDSGLTAATHYYYKINVQDSAGNLSAYSDTVDDIPDGAGSSDSTAPTISSVAISGIGTTSATVTWTTNELSSSSVGYSTDATYLPTTGNASMVTSHSVIVTGILPNTIYNIQVKSQDASGNEATNDKDSPGSSPIANYTFTTLDGPAISNVTAPQVSNNQVTISWLTTVDSDTQVIYSDTLSSGALVGAETIPAVSGGLVGGSYPYVHTQIVNSFEGSPLVSGTTYYFYVQSTDASSNVATDNNAGNFYSFVTTSDVVAPVISNPNVAIINNTSAAINWTTDENANSKVSYGTVSGVLGSTGTVATYDKSHYVILTGLTANTKYYYTVTSVDINTNSTISVEYNFTTLRVPGEQHDALSAITNIADPPSVITDTKAVVTFNTDQNAKCTIEYGTASGSYTEVPIAETLYNSNHSIHVTGLIFSTTYYYRITCVDNLDNTVMSSEYSFITSAELLTSSGWGDTADATAPSISGINIGTITGESVTATWTTDEEANSLVAYGLVDGTYDNIAGNYEVNSDSANYVTDHSVIINGLIPASKYYYTIISTDAAGNIAESAQGNFTTSEPSTLSSIKVVSTSLNQAVITWSTSKDTTSTVEYGLTTSYGETKESTTLTKVHEVTLTSLISSQIYHFRVKGKDATNNLYSSGDYTFEPKSPPAISGTEITDVTENSVVVKFTTNVPTDALISYTDLSEGKGSGFQGVPTLTSTHEVELKNLIAGTTFSTKIKARDEEGNETEQDGPNFTTGKDENAPKIDQIRTDSALAQGDRVQTIISWTTDEPATTALIYKEGKSGQEKEVKISEDFAPSHIAVVTIFKPGTVYYFKAKSIDKSGNEGTSTEYALLTPRRKENVVQMIINNFQDIFGWVRR